MMMMNQYYDAKYNKAVDILLHQHNEKKFCTKNVQLHLNYHKKDSQIIHLSLKISMSVTKLSLLNACWLDRL